MKTFTISMGEKDLKKIRKFLEGSSGEEYKDVSDEEILKELFFMDDLRTGLELDLREAIKIKEE